MSQLSTDEMNTDLKQIHIASGMKKPIVDLEVGKKGKYIEIKWTGTEMQELSRLSQIAPVLFLPQ